jgi:hypothetical protein
MAYALALLAAFANAWSAVCQRLAVQGAGDQSAMSLGLLRHALSRAIWFAGLALIAAGFVLQAVALRFGQLSSVQPVVTTELLCLVLILAVWFRYPLTWREWGSAAAAAGGLAVFLVIAHPGGGTATPSLHRWLAMATVVGVLVAAATGLGFVGPRWFRSAMFGSAGAMVFAVSAALTKQFTDLVTSGWGHVFTSPVPYVLVGTGLLGLVLVQSSFHAGPITASQSTLTIVDPLTSVVIGIWLFHDHLAASGWRLPVEVVAIVVVVVGVVTISRSPVVAGARDDRPEADALVRQPRRSRAA